MHNEFFVIFVDKAKICLYYLGFFGMFLEKNLRGSISNQNPENTKKKRDSKKNFGPVFGPVFETNFGPVRNPEVKKSCELFFRVTRVWFSKSYHDQMVQIKMFVISDDEILSVKVT